MKFHYRETVKVVGGFYAGQDGIVIDYELKLGWCRLRRIYYICLTKYLAEKYVWVDEEDLEKADQ